MRYQDTLKNHLADYKRKSLGIDAPGIFNHRGQAKEYHHILPHAYAMQNLMDEARPAAVSFLTANPSKRHKYFHHLNSSQAFTFNLFFPYFSGGAAVASSLLRALGQDAELLEWEPEVIPDIDEQTNVDVVWKTSDGVKTYCEVKLSEAEFGTAIVDDRHQSKLSQIYQPILKACLDTRQLEAAAFFKSYQFYRNLWHMAVGEQARLIFLLPRANSRLWLQLQRLISGVTLPTRNRISVVAVEDVIQRISADDRCSERLRAYAKRIAQKYVI